MKYTTLQQAIEELLRSEEMRLLSVTHFETKHIETDDSMHTEDENGQITKLNGTVARLVTSDGRHAVVSLVIDFRPVQGLDIREIHN